MKMTAKEKKERLKEAVQRIRKLCPDGSTIYSVNTGYAKSGMGGKYKFFAIGTYEGKPEITDVTGDLSWITGWRFTEEGSLYVAGCGLNRAHHAVSTAASIIRTNTDPEYDLRHKDL